MDKTIEPVKKYKLGNRNSKRELLSISKSLENSDLTDSQLEYIKNRFIEALFALDKLAIENKLLFQLLRVAVLICGILIIAVVNLPQYIKHTTLIVTILSVISSVCFGVLQLFRNDTMWAHHRLKFEKIRKELYLFLNLSSEIYSDSKSHSESFKVFVERSENLFDKEIIDYFTNLQIGSNCVTMIKNE